MKSLKFFLAAAFLFVFSVGLAFGQVSNSKKQVVTGTLILSGELPCIGPINGEVSSVLTSWENKMQWRANGNLVGEAGKVYELCLVQNNMFKDLVLGQAYRFSLVAKGEIYFEGQLIAFIKVLLHFTYNAKGEPTADFIKYPYGWVCL